MRIRFAITLTFGDKPTPPEPDERYVDAIGHYQQTGFTTEREGRIEEVQ